MASFAFNEGDKFVHCGHWGAWYNGRVGTIVNIVRNRYGRIDLVCVKWDGIMGLEEIQFTEALRSFRPASLCHRCTNRLERMTARDRCKGKHFVPLAGVWQNYWQERINEGSPSKIKKEEDELSQDLF